MKKSRQHVWNILFNATSRPLETFEGILVHLLWCWNLWLLQLLVLPLYPSSASLPFYTSGFILIAPLASLASLARSLAALA